MKRIIVSFLLVFCFALSGCLISDDSHDEKILTVLNQPTTGYSEITVYESTTAPTTKTELNDMMGTWNSNTICHAYFSGSDNGIWTLNTLVQGTHLVTVGSIMENWKFGMATFDKWGCATIDYNTMKFKSELPD